eukprot:GCRY01006920.1.p1 GENE.GCRY01006920.1~~GCRY01006920.1.p1  ORF type:complete len:236 (+),score=28.99 GCRY01006920.1:62-769(+)
MPKFTRNYVNEVFSLNNLAKAPGSSIKLPSHLTVHNKAERLPKPPIEKNIESKTMFRFFLKRVDNSNTSTIGSYMFKNADDDDELHSDDQTKSIEPNMKKTHFSTEFGRVWTDQKTIEELERRGKEAENEERRKVEFREKREMEAQEKAKKKRRIEEEKRTKKTIREEQQFKRKQDAERRRKENIAKKNLKQQKIESESNRTPKENRDDNTMEHSFLQEDDHVHDFVCRKHYVSS